MFERHFSPASPRPQSRFDGPPPRQVVFIGFDFAAPRPPVAIKPRKVWLRERLMDIVLAISLCNLEDQVVPGDWTVELMTITCEINEMIEEGCSS